MCVKCQMDGKLPLDEKPVMVCDAFTAFRCHLKGMTLFMWQALNERGDNP